jgi:two-component system OmpR family sensor kinase
MRIPRAARSTRVRIFGLVLVPVLLVLSLSWLAAWWLLTQRLDERIDTELAGEVSELRLLAGDGVDPQSGSALTDVAELLELHIERSLPDPNETMFIVIDGQVVSRSSDSPPVRLDLDPELVDTVSSVDQVTYGNTDTSAGDVRWVAVPVRADGQQGVFVVGIFADLEGSDLAAILSRFALASGATLLLAAMLGWFVAGRLLRPLRHMRTTAQTITETDLSQRIPVSESATGEEVADLAMTFNDMLDRLQDAFAAQRAFIDDAGHELRTPLTIAQGHLELLDAGDADDREATLRLVLDELARMNRIVRDLQTLTKANQPGFVHPEQTDLAPLMDELLVKAAGLGDRDWQLIDAPEISVRLDRQRVTQAVLQLAENAVRHTQPGDSIRLIGDVTPAGVVTITVADSGPGIPEADRARVSQRFFRGGATATNGEGAGLGLALVSAIAVGHHGTLSIDDSELGGAAMSLVLPEAAFHAPSAADARA